MQQAVCEKAGRELISYMSMRDKRPAEQPKWVQMLRLPGFVAFSLFSSLCIKVTF